MKRLLCGSTCHSFNPFPRPKGRLELTSVPAPSVRVSGESRCPHSASPTRAGLTYPAGDESATGCSCIVSSPSFVKAAPAAEKISPTCRWGSITGAALRGAPRRPAPAPSPTPGSIPAGLPPPKPYPRRKRRQRTGGGRAGTARGRQGALSAREVEPWWTLTSWSVRLRHGDAAAAAAAREPGPPSASRANARPAQEVPPLPAPDWLELARSASSQQIS